MKTYKSNLPEIQLKYKTGEIKRFKVTTSQDAYYAIKKLFDQDSLELREEFIAVFFNRHNNSIGWFKVSQGGLAGTVVDPKLVFSVALKAGAHSIILAHNHPSGECFPSEQDRRMTKKMQDGGKLLDIAILDHLIVCEKAYFSFSDDQKYEM